MTYEETIDYLYSQLPAYQRIGKAAYKADLQTTWRLAEILGNPHKHFRSIHVAGTNGKGSVAHTLASVLQEAGYKTGLYTSPHLRDFRERIRINGEMIGKEKVMDFVARYQEKFTAIAPSFFEWTVGLAFKYFEEEKIDIAVVETGMGGRLDSTNILTPELSVITNIGYDHAAFLGNTLELIAGEKAGIIKEGVQVVIGQTQALTEDVFRRVAGEKHSPIHFADQEIAEVTYTSDLKGIYQVHNRKTVMCALELLREAGWKISEAAIKRGFAHVVKNTGLMGRWQTLSEKPLAICDTGHNEDGVRMVVQQLASIPCQQLHFVFGMVNDKEAGKILDLLPREALYYFCRPDLPRGLDAGELAAAAREKGLKGIVFPSVPEAYKAALVAAGPNDLVFVGGSTFVVAEVV